MRLVIGRGALTVLLISACQPETAERVDPIRDRDETTGELASTTEAPATTDTASPLRCTVSELGRVHIKLESEEEVYVEPHGFVALERGFLLAGQPTFEWTVDPRGHATLAGQDRFLGVIREGVVVRTIPPPPGVRVPAWTYVGGLGRSRWGFLIEDLEDSSIGSDATLRLVYAEYDGQEWSAPEVIAVPTGGRVTVGTGSALVVEEDRIRWAARFAKERGGTDVLLFERSASGWSHSVAAEDWVDEVGLYRTPTGDLWVAVGGLDPDHGSQLASLRLTRAAGSTPQTTRLGVGAPGERFRDLRFARSGRGTALAWRRLAESTALGPAWLQRDLESWWDADSRERAEVVMLDPRAVDLVPLPGPDGTTLWLLHHIASSTNSETLRILRDDGTRLSTVTEIPYPYVGPFGASITPSGDLLVVGPDVDPDPLFPSVRSLVLRLSLSCT